MSADLLAAIGRAVLAHCPHTLGLSERWARPASEWKVERPPCEACAELAVALRMAGTSPADVQEH